MANEQDMPVAEKPNPVLGATEKEQDMSRLDQIVVPVGAFTDPHNPYSHSLSVNLSLEDAPLQHSPDYAADVLPGKHLDRTNTMSEGAKTLQSEDVDALDLPEDRGEWTKAHWQRAAKHFGLATSGNLKTLKKRVTDHEESQAETDERAKELHAMKREELDELAPQYDIDPSEHSTKEELADAILAAESEA